MSEQDIKTIKEINARGIFPAKVSKSSTSATINFKKKFRGRNVVVIVPEELTCYSLLSRSVLLALHDKVDDLEFSKKYSVSKKNQLKERIQYIIKHGDQFPEQYIYDIYDSFNKSKDKEVMKIIKKIKEDYSL